jgi:Ca2+-binding RTX toxin-like protein
MASSFTVNLNDLIKILAQIKIAERHAAGEDLTSIIGPDAALLPFGLRTVDGSFNHLLPGREQVGAADGLFPRLLAPEYRTVNDNYELLLVPNGAPGAPPGGVVITNNNYDPTIPGSRSVADADPRIISNLIVDQTNNNPAAVAAWFANEKSQAAYADAHGGNAPPPGYIPTNEEIALIFNASPDIGLSPGFNSWMTFFGQFFDHGLDLVTKGGNGTVYIPLQADDPLYDKGADGLVGPQTIVNADGTTTTINDDGFGADGIFNTIDDRPNFMALTRVTTFVDPVTGLKTESQNTTTPFIDQNQTYTSVASHQVFLREYNMIDIAADGVAGPVAASSGRLLDGSGGKIANWAEVKAQSQNMLGLTLSDHDVNDVPLLVTDPYGKFIAGSNGFAQVVVGIKVIDSATGALVSTAPGNFTAEGIAGGLDLANISIAQVQLPGGITLPDLPAGQQYVVTPVGTGHAFLNDIAHHAAPGKVDHDGNPATPKIKQVADSDILDANGDGTSDAADVAFLGTRLSDANGDGAIDVLDLADVNLNGVIDAQDLIANDSNPLTYDNEMLDSHFITGDGRGNENIGLTAVHSIFHTEHNRVVEENKDTIIASGDRAIINEWLLTPLSETDPIPTTAAEIDALPWNGERLFQAGRFVTEMQYQHLVFEEFARKIQPNIDAFVFTNSAELDPSITAEFAHVVYRFGHSMLNNTVDRLNLNLETIDGGPQIGLIEAFLNPQSFNEGGAEAYDIVGDIIRGTTRDLGNEIDEFVVDALRSNLVGLPLDLAALNIARGRETGVPSFNDARAQFYASTGDAQLRPYESWLDFGQNIKNPVSIVNFVAAYGQHSTILAQTTAAGKRDAAMELVFGIDVDGDGIVPLDAEDFMNGTGAWTAENSGLNNVDLWIGGLAEAKMEFGGMLGSTFSYVFETQLESLQNGDRFYYLSRTQGMNLLTQLELNTFSDIVQRNTNLGELHSTHVSGALFDTPDAILELDKLVAQEGDTFDALGNRVRHDPVWNDGLVHLGTKVVRTNGTTDVNGDGYVDGNVLKFFGGEHVVLGGTEGNDRLFGDKGIDTLWGDGGNDYLNAGSEADQVFAGDGDDIIEDFFGDGDFLRGGKGNDVISDTHGFGDVLFGEAGNDFIMGGSDVIEIFAGEGDDFLLGGNGSDVLFGNEGNDWIEGGEGFDGLAGENSELFFDSPIIGHDVLNGQGNDTDYDGESGDDIMFLNLGITRANGMFGFDWVVSKGDTNTSGMYVDLGISRFVNQQALILRDRNDSVEAASGWKYNDTIIGTSSPNGGGAGDGAFAGPITDSMLLSQNVSLINGLETLLMLAPGALRGQTVGTDGTPFADLAKDTFVFDPTSGGDILLGGAGSDVLYGKAGNDIIDGDRWLNVRLEVHANTDGTGPLVTNLASVGADGSIDSLNEIKSDLLAGRINPGQLQIVREIITTGATAANTDVVMYAGSRSDYTIVANANGTITITDNVTTRILVNDPFGGPPAFDTLLGNEGTDTLSNIEIARFTNRDANGVPTGTFTDVFISQRAATGAPVVIDANGGTPTQGQQLIANTSGIADLNGLGAFSYQWQIAPAGTPANGAWTNLAGATNQSFTPSDLEVGQVLRVVVSYTDPLGAFESVSSIPTGGVGLVFNGTTGDDNPVLSAYDDIANGLGGNDTLEGGGGNDTLNGGAGTDTATYANSAAGVNASLLLAGMQNTVGAGSDTLIGIENLTGSAFNDNLMGSAGVNVLIGGLGDDVLNGGAGVDLVTYESATSGVTASLSTLGPQDTGAAGNDTLIAVENLTGSAFNDTLSGSAAANLILGAIGDDTLNGLGGIDILDGGVGTDTMDGGDGNDTFRVDSTSDVVIEAAGAAGGVDTVLSVANVYTLSSNVERLTFTGVGDFIGTGSSEANVITGGIGNDILDGGAGADTLIGGAGNDTYIVDHSSDIITEGFGAAFGTDTVNATANSYTLTLNLENLSFIGTGDFNGTGSAGGNIITGAAGNDTLNGGLGNDTLVGQAGNNSLAGGGGIDAVSYVAAAGGVTLSLVAGVGATANGSGGSDTLNTIENVIGSNHGDNITGDGLGNRLEGGLGSDTILGNGGVDTLFGGDGDDILNGGIGNDIIDAGVGADFINQLSSEGRDFIDGGTSAGEKDTYQLTGVAAAETFNIYTRTAYLALVPTAVLNATTEIVVTRNGTAVANIIAELDNIEEITVNTLDTSANDGNGAVNGGTNGGDTINVIGDFTSTSLDYSTITVNGSTATDKVNITDLTSAHRIVFNTSGGQDAIVGTIRPQDVINGAGQSGTPGPQGSHSGAAGGNAGIPEQSGGQRQILSEVSWLDFAGFDFGNFHDRFIIDARVNDAIQMTPAMLSQLAPISQTAAAIPSQVSLSETGSPDLYFKWLDDGDQAENHFHFTHDSMFG